MKYLIISKDSYGFDRSFYADYFDLDKHYISGMIVINQIDHTVTYDGLVWSKITETKLKND